MNEHSFTWHADGDPESRLKLKSVTRFLHQPWPLLVLFLCIGSGVRIVSLDVGSRTRDEIVYTRQANVWLESGRPGLRNLVEEYRRDPVTRYYPMPTRAGMIRLLASAMTLSGRHDAFVGAVVSCAASIAALVLVGLIGIRFLSPWAATIAVLLFSVFPPELAIARRTWTDALVELIALTLVWVVCEIARDSERRIWYLIFATIGSIGLTIKESMPVPYAICGLWLVYFLLKRGKRENALILTGAAIVGSVISVSWLARMAGSFADLTAIVTGIAGVNATNPYALEWASGPGYLLLDGFWIVSPGVALLGMAGVFSALKWQSTPAEQGHAALWIATFTVSNVAIAMIIPHWLNLRYVSVAFGTCCLLAGVGAEYLYLRAQSHVAAARRTVFTVIVAAIILGSAASDYQYFHRVFVRNATPDLAIGMLRLQRER